MAKISSRGNREKKLLKKLKPISTRKKKKTIEKIMFIVPICSDLYGTLFHACFQYGKPFKALPPTHAFFFASAYSNFPFLDFSLCSPRLFFRKETEKHSTFRHLTASFSSYSYRYEGKAASKQPTTTCSYSLPFLLALAGFNVLLFPARKMNCLVSSTN